MTTSESVRLRAESARVLQDRLSDASAARQREADFQRFKWEDGKAAALVMGAAGLSAPLTAAAVFSPEVAIGLGLLGIGDGSKNLLEGLNSGDTYQAVMGGLEMVGGAFGLKAGIAEGMVRSTSDTIPSRFTPKQLEAISTEIGGVPNTTDVNVVGDAASATDPGRVTVYRVEGSPNQRLIIDDLGNVSIAPGNKSTIWLNFGETGRATDYLSTKVAQGLPDAQLKSFEIYPAFLEQVQSQAVPEQFAHTFPDRPIISADPFPNQFGIRQNQFQQLLDSIYQGSGKNVPPGGN